MRKMIALSCLAVLAAACTPHRLPHTKLVEPSSRRMVRLLLLGDIHFVMPEGDEWILSNDTPPGYVALLTDVRNHVGIGLRLLPGDLKQALAAERSFTDERRDEDTVVSRVESLQGGDVLYWRVTDMGKDGRPVLHHFTALRRLNGRTDRTVKVTGSWNDVSDAHYTAVVLELISTVGASTR